MKRRDFFALAPAILSLSKTPLRASELSCDIAVIGAGVGGFAAALSALQRGKRVILTEETDWIGGQLTSQAVPPDEHPWIEQFGCTRSYRAYRNAVRDYYKRNYPLTPAARERPNLNPGNGTVSRIAHEFRVSKNVLEDMLAPYLGNGQLILLLNHVAVSASVKGDSVETVTVRNLLAGDTLVIAARYFIDATELGDLLPLTGTEYVTGAEAQSKTGESHAAPQSKPSNSQSFTYCFAIDYLEGEDHVIEKPRAYSFWRNYVPQLSPAWVGPLFNWNYCDPKTLKPARGFLGIDEKAEPGGRDLWSYRRIADRSNFTPGSYRGDISLVNWPQNDFWLEDLVTASADAKKEYMDRAKQLSLSFLYWLQTEAPRSGGGYGWKGLRLRGDIVDTIDGLAKSPYIRESRRIQAEFTVLEQHVGTEMRMAETHRKDTEVSAANFEDSVGIGCYRIDLHPSAGGINYIDISSLPFQIPLGALLPVRMENLLPACKNLGATHITNGCYRLHPVEWNIGESAGAFASYAIQVQERPRAVRANKRLLAEFQTSLRAQGVELEWPRIHPV